MGKKEEETTGAGQIAGTGTEETRVKVGKVFGEKTALDNFIDKFRTKTTTTVPAQDAPAKRENIQRQNQNRKTGGYPGS